MYERGATVRTTLIVLVACLLATGVAVAQKEDNADDTDLPERVDCITDGYIAYNGPGGSIPDGDIHGAVFGLLPTAEGDIIEDVILSVDISHTWIGDLRLWLLYDTDCDGLVEFIGQVLCRHGMEGCPPDGCCGCSGELNGLYLFDDTVPSIEDVCPTTFDPGCYGPDFDSVGLDVFDGLPSGGCWMLWAADGADWDEGGVCQWTAYVLYEGTPVEHSSWGSMKALYR